MEVQKNQLGITNFETLEEAERKIVSDKQQKINSSMTFGENWLNLRYLEKLHCYLFGDIYEKEDLKIRTVYEREDLEKINAFLFQINQKELTEQEEKVAFQKLWDLQLFKDGNTRTLISYFKVYKEKSKMMNEKSNENLLKNWKEK